MERRAARNLAEKPQGACRCHDQTDRVGTDEALPLPALLLSPPVDGMRVADVTFHRPAVAILVDDVVGASRQSGGAKGCDGGERLSVPGPFGGVFALTSQPHDPPEAPRQHRRPQAIPGLDLRARFAGGGAHHLRVLNAPVPRQPHVSSCRFMRSVGVCRGSLCQPGAHGCFLRPPAPWTATEQAAQPREARLETGRRPAARHLLPPRVEPQPPAQPPAHHRQLGRGARAQQGAPPRRGGFRQRPGHQPCPHRGFPTREGLPPSLVETQPGLHFCPHERPWPARPRQAQPVGGRPGRRRQGGEHAEPTGPSQRGRRAGAPGWRRCAALAAPRLPRASRRRPTGERACAPARIARPRRRPHAPTRAPAPGGAGGDGRSRSPPPDAVSRPGSTVQVPPDDAGGRPWPGCPSCRRFPDSIRAADGLRP